MNRWHIDYTKDNYENAWKEIRRRILKRDRYQCRVFACTVKGAKSLTVHHIVPRDEGGGDNDANLITLCPKHHDEIEIEHIRQVTLIEAWEGIGEVRSGLEDMTRTILATINKQEPSTGEVPVKNRTTNAVKVKRAPQHRCADSTVEALDALMIGSTLAEVTKHLGYSPQFASTLSAILHHRPGAISAKREDELRERLGLPRIAPVRVKRSDKVPTVEAPLRVSKRPPPVRKRQKPAPERKQQVAWQERIATTKANEPGYTEEYVILGEDNEWSYAPRKDTTIGIRVTDADWFDALAKLTKMSKADMFSEILGFYLKAHSIAFVECSEDEYAIVEKVYGYILRDGNITLPIQLVGQLITDYCLARNVKAIDMEPAYFSSLIGSQDFNDFASDWISNVLNEDTDNGSA